MSFNTFGQTSKSFGGFTPIWLEVSGVKQAGGTLKAPTSYAVDYPVGSVIPAGTPVYLAKSGGDLIPLQTFELAQDIAAIDTVIKFKSNGSVPQIKAGMNLMKAGATYATTGTAYAVPANIAIVGDNCEVTIVADAWGHTGKAGDIYVEANGVGASKLPFTTPNGLLWHDIVIETGDTVATGAVVYDGSILVDRISPIPDCVKAALPSINFEKES
jgi:hypothetical protein